MADFTTPHRFLETILSGPMDGRRKLYGRLGMAARDPIDELLASALEFEHQEIASLDRFLAWFARGEVEIKRDPSAPTNAVRVMTVHGAKGLEAPIVILADATADPAKLGGVSRTLDFPLPEVGEVPLIRPRKAERVSPVRGAHQPPRKSATCEEHWRLLYVALTRAEERLVIAGLQPKTNGGARPENSWHLRVERALVSLGAQPEDDASLGSRRCATAARSPPSPVKPKPAPVALAGPQVPAWAKTAAPPEARPPQPLAPSAMAEDSEAAPPPSEAQRAAAERGTLIHQLLERLAPVHPDERHATALRWLERSAGVADGDARKEIADTVCAVLSPIRASRLVRRRLARRSASCRDPCRTDGSSRARSTACSSSRTRVSVIDFKTGRVPEFGRRNSGLAQGADERLYARRLRVIFPGREVRAALLYTSGPRLFELQC